MQNMHHFLGSHPWLMHPVLMQMLEPAPGEDGSVGCAPASEYFFKILHITEAAAGLRTTALNIQHLMLDCF